MPFTPDNSAGPVEGYGDSYKNFVAAFAQPFISWPSVGTTVNYSVGTVISPTSLATVDIVADSLDVTDNTTNYIYWDGAATSLATTTNPATAQAAVWLYAVVVASNRVTSAVAVSSMLPIVVGGGGGGGGTPGGSTGQLQWNDSGTFAGIAGSNVDGEGNVTFGKNLVVTGAGVSQVSFLSAGLNRIQLDDTLGIDIDIESGGGMAINSGQGGMNLQVALTGDPLNIFSQGGINIDTTYLGGALPINLTSADGGIVLTSSGSISFNGSGGFFFLDNESSVQAAIAVGGLLGAGNIYIGSKGADGITFDSTGADLGGGGTGPINLTSAGGVQFDESSSNGVQFDLTDGTGEFSVLSPGGTIFRDSSDINGLVFLQTSTGGILFDATGDGTGDGPGTGDMGFISAGSEGFGFDGVGSAGFNAVLGGTGRFQFNTTGGGGAGSGDFEVDTSGTGGFFVDTTAGTGPVQFATVGGMTFTDNSATGVSLVSINGQVSLNGLSLAFIGDTSVFDIDSTIDGVATLSTILNAVGGYQANGVPGISGTGTTMTNVTVVNGLITNATFT